MQAILTKYHSPTNFKGSRYSAECERGKIFVHADDALNPEDNHKSACDALVARFIKEDAERYGTNPNPWAKARVMGCLPSGDYAHVYLPNVYRFTFVGRPIGAIGKTWEHTAERFGHTEEAAKESLWETYEHISITKTELVA